jgi:hypothetical protein
MSNSKKYAADLKELTTQFYLILERYKKAYPPYAANPNEENTTIYLASKSQLDNIFKDLVLLENNVNSSSGVLSTSSNGLDTNIDKLHKKYSKERHELKKIRDFNLASYPMKREFQQSRQHGYVDIIFFSVGISVLVYLLWLAITGGFKEANRKGLLHKLPPSMIPTPKTAKRITGGIVIIVGIIVSIYTPK